MSALDKNRIGKLWEQSQREKNVYSLEGAYYVLSVDRTGAIGVSGKYYATEDIQDFRWIEPIKVFGVEEPSGSKQTYSAKTQQLLDLFKPGSVHFRMLEAHVKLTASMWETSDDEKEMEFYYNSKDNMFVGVNQSYDRANCFKAIMKLRSNKTNS